MIKVGSERYTLLLSTGGVPPFHDSYVKHAELHDDLARRGTERDSAFVAVQRNAADWPHLAVSFGRRGIPGFPLGILIIPETDLLLIGSDETLLAYDLRQPRKLWSSTTLVGFWQWRRHNDVVLMSAELELAAYSLEGGRLWSEWVEPPWDYNVTGDRLNLDVMGQVSTLSVHRGRP